MLDELALNYYNEPFMPEEEVDPTLESWVSQGILMLNASLSCTQFKPEGPEALFQEGTHSYFWRTIMIEALFAYLNDTLQNTVFVFLGKKAQYYNKFITSRNKLINVYHPVADYRTGKEMFRGSKMFNNINQLVKGDPIDWKLKRQ